MISLVVNIDVYNGKLEEVSNFGISFLDFYVYKGEKFRACGIWWRQTRVGNASCVSQDLLYSRVVDTEVSRLSVEVTKGVFV